ncbi:unnamed protein product [Caenorhabditis nigoni]
MMEWLIEFQPTIRSVWIPDGVINSPELLDRMLKNLKMLRFDLGSIKTDKSIQIMEPISSQSILIWNPDWITLSSILNGTNSMIRLYYSKLEPKDINTILKEWQMGSKLQKLEYLEIKTSLLLDDDIYANEVLKDLNVTVVDGFDERPMGVILKDDDDNVEEIHYPSRVERNNGNAIEDLKQMVEHICEVFRSPIREITIVEQSLIDWIIKFQPTIPYLTIEKDVITSVGTLDCIFEDLKVTKHFVLNSIRSAKKIQCTEPISFPSISIHNSYWFTVPLILNGNNSIIRLYDSKLTPKDINTILKEWQKGAKLQNLKYLEIQTTTHLYDNDCSDEIFKYLYPTSVHRNEGRPKTVSIDDEWTYTLPELPRAVLLECIESLDILEIILFSLVSKRASSTIKLIRCRPLDIRLRTDSQPQIRLRRSNNPGRIWIIDFNNESEYSYFQSVVEGPRAMHYLVLNDNGNAIEHLKQMTDHVCEVLRSPIHFIELVEQSMIEWIIKTRPEIHHVYITKNVVVSGENLDCLLKSLKNTKTFHMESNAIVDENFQYIDPIPFPSISIYNSSWITLPSILNGTNSKILLYNSKWTPNDINTMLKKWQMGFKLRNLEFFVIQTIIEDEDYDYCTREMFKDLNITVCAERDGRPMKVNSNDAWIYTLREGTSIVKLDGNSQTLFSTLSEDHNLINGLNRILI